MANKDEERKGFLDTLKDMLPSAKRLQEAEAKAQEAEARAQEAEERARIAETKIKEAEERARVAEEKLKAIEEEIERAKAEAEANKSPEEKRKERTNQAFEAINEAKQSALRSYNLEKIFHKTLGVANQYLDDPQIISAIIKKYPESIVEIPNDYFASNFEEFTTSFLAGISEVCADPQKQRYRVNYTAMEKDENNRDIPFDKDLFIRNMLYEARFVFRDKMDAICSRAKEIVEAKKASPDNPYKDINPKDLTPEAYPKIKFEKDDTEAAQFAKQVKYRKDEAALAAKIIADETEKE